jgi:hypothetical protein
MDIAELEPRQLAPSVGTTGSGSTDSPAPSPTTSKIDINTIVGIAAPTDVDTTSKIDIDTIVGIAALTDVDTTSKIDIDTVVGIATSTDVDTSSKIDIDTIAGIAVPAIVNASPMEPEIDAADSTVIDNVSPGTINLTLTADVFDPASGTTGIAPGGYDMAFRLFNFHVDSSGAIELLSIAESAPLEAETAKPSAIGGKPSTSESLASPKEGPKPKISTPSVGSNDFEDHRPIPPMSANPRQGGRQPGQCRLKVPPNTARSHLRRDIRALRQDQASN